MRPVEMNTMGMLAAAIYAILDEKAVTDFSVLVEPPTTAHSNCEFFGNICGHARIQAAKADLTYDFKVYVNDKDTLVTEVTCNKCYYGLDVITCNCSGDVEINFKDKSITYKESYDFLCTNLRSWCWQGVRLTALDIIRMILGEKNS